MNSMFNKDACYRYFLWPPSEKIAMHQWS